MWAVLSVLTAATLWASIGPSYALLTDAGGAEPLDIVTLRALAAALVFGLWLLRTKPGAFQIRRRDTAFMIAFGLITVTAFYPVLIYSYQASGVAVGALLLYLAPVFVTLTAAMVLAEPLTIRKVGAIVLSLTGLALVVGAFHPGTLAASPLGIVLGVASAVCYGAYSLLGKPLLDRYPRSTVLAYHLLIGAGGLVAVRFVVTREPWPDIGTILVIAGYNGIMTTLIPIALYTIGLTWLPSSEASILATWEPAVALLLATTILGESMDAGQLAGALLILASVLLLSVSERSPGVPSRTVN